MDTRIADAANLPDGPGPDGDAAFAVDAREESRRARLAKLDEMDEMVCFAARRLTDYIAGGISGEEAQAFAGIADPCLTLTRLARAQRQIMAFQEKLEDDAETRARRLADEAAKRETALRAEEAEQDAAEKTERIEANKRRIRHAIKEASFESGPGPGLPSGERERLLADLMSDYERHDDLDRDLVEIMEDLEREAALMAGRAQPERPQDEAAAGLQQLIVTVEQRLLGLLAETAPKEPAKPDVKPARRRRRKPP